MALASPAGIADIAAAVERLSPSARARLRRIFDIRVVSGRLEAPATMLGFLQRQFGSAAVVAEQKVVKVTNLVTGEGAIFNPVRALRPRRFEDRLAVEGRVIDEARADPLSRPLLDTPADTFGRVRGRYCVTASNVAKYDGMHGIVIFDRHNPLEFTREEVIDYLDTGWRWAHRAHRAEPEARYYFFLWNCLQRAGATLDHGHCQVVLGRGRHYAKIEALRQAAAGYRARYGTDYFRDLYRCHESLGLGFEREGVRVFASLTPVKEKEVVLMAPRFSASLKQRVYETLACLRDAEHVTSFNLGLTAPPIGAAPTPENWRGFPVIVRVVDRGYPWDASSDFGTMELYAASVVSSDPVRVAVSLRAGSCAVEP